VRLEADFYVHVIMIVIGLMLLNFAVFKEHNYVILVPVSWLMAW